MTTDDFLLGSHMSTAGGMANAFERGESAGCTAMQVFVKGNTRWQFPPLKEDDVRRFRAFAEISPVRSVIAHAIYLVNLASDKPDFMRKSVDDLVDELTRCDALGIPGLVMHPGAHCGAGVEEGITRIVARLDEVFDATPDGRCQILLETTAGQGSCIGHELDHLKQIIERVAKPERLGVCVDTCHVFSAGYEINTREGYDSFWKEFSDLLGMDRLKALHLNDSMKPFASKLDRHEHIGKGTLGLEAFRMIMNDERLRRVPMVLETDKSADLHEDRENIALLRSLKE